MDRLESLGNTLSQITMYDIKSMYTQAKNVVLNVSEMEAKVREATNDDPWGASSTLMQEIAQGTFNFQNFNEIMPCIYARFMEKEARQWRQIYKALQLLEYLIKHGSERVVDDARSHISTLKMLRNFHYIDDKGKDEGVNVRNRSRELVELLSDVEKIRAERRKAKANRNKYIGTGNEGLSFSSTGGRYGGFGNDGFGGGSYSGGRSSPYGSGGSYERDYGSYSGDGSGGFRDDNSRRGFEEYNAGDDETTTVRRSGSQRVTSDSRGGPRSSTAPPSAPPPKAKEPDVDLLGFGDDDAFSSGTTALATDKALPAVNALVSSEADDDFADFQAAPVSSVTAPSKPSLMDLLNSNTTAPTTTTARPPMHAVTSSFSQPSFQTPGSAFGVLSPTSTRQSFASPGPLTGSQPMKPSSPVTRTTPATSPGPAAAKPTSNFDDLWSMSLGSAASSAPKSSTGGKSIKDLEKEKAQAGIWGAQKPVGTTQFGSFRGGSFGASSATGTSAGAATSNSADDDLLL